MQSTTPHVGIGIVGNGESTQLTDKTDWLKEPRIHRIRSTEFDILNSPSWSNRVSRPIKRCTIPNTSPHSMLLMDRRRVILILLAISPKRSDFEENTEKGKDAIPLC
jgi:hypothetical protein